jgi:hypothetical protein
MGPVLKRVVVAAVPCLLLLSGCGVAETQFHPGVAARVGDQTVTTDRVDELTTAYCAAVEAEITAGGQAFPLAGFKTGVAAQLAMISAVDQLSVAYDVSPSSEFKSQQASIRSQAPGITGDDLDAYVEVQSAQAYIGDLLTQIGAIELEREGEQEPTIDFQQARGQDALATWVEREGLAFDPRYGLEVVDGQPSPVDTDVSFAFSDLSQAAKAGGDPDANYVASLPLSATCG